MTYQEKLKLEINTTDGTHGQLQVEPKPFRQARVNMARAERYQQDLTSLKSLLLKVAAAEDHVAAAKEANILSVLREVTKSIANFRLESDVMHGPTSSHMYPPLNPNHH